ncbi:hypothetical protein SNE40_006017 [Patella caerulea]|uniref:Uncharacterized protein n=1 Tax=Patella caerulea TaxID=87958 RepID=A0AAN8K8R4_PATCE
MAVTYSSQDLFSYNNSEQLQLGLINTLRQIGIYTFKKTKRGRRAGRKIYNRVPEIRSLHVEQTTPNKETTPTKSELNICLINIRSVVEKCVSLTDYLNDQKCDLALITETWLNNKVSGPVTSELKSLGYNLYHVPRKNRGGGVGILCKHNQQVELKTSENYRSFEKMEFITKSQTESVRIALIYI